MSMIKHERIYIPPPHREPLKWKLFYWATHLLFAALVIGFAIALMWVLSMIHDGGGFEQFSMVSHEAIAEHLSG